MSMSLSTPHSLPLPAQIAAVASLRSRLWESGFRPVAVYNIKSGEENSGKAPKGLAWQERARQTPPDGAESAPEPDALNTGILCDGLRAIDLDIEDAAIVGQIKAAVLARWGEAPIRYRTNSPRILIVYRASEGEPPKRKIAGPRHKLEVLGHGQQFVAFGRHWSGADLQWIGDAPGETTIDQIPAVTEDDVTKLLAFAAPLIGAKPENYRTGVGAVSVQGLQAADALQVVAAMCAIPNDGPTDWEHWNRVGMALFAATAGSMAGQGMWHAWSQQHASYDATAAQERWDHYHQSPPSKIGAGTLFHMARQRTSEPEEPPLDDVPHPDSHDDYGVIEPELPVENRKTLYLITQAWTEQEIPQRPWVAPGFLLRNAVTILGGPPSAGKSSLTVAWTAAHATGREFGRFRPYKPGPLKTLFYNVEDDADEQRRRYSAMARQFDTTPSDLLKNLILCGPNDVGTLLHLNRDGNVLLNTSAMDELDQIIGDLKPDSAWLDPFVELHGAEENDNTAIRLVLAAFRSFARRHSLALGILAHTRKGAATPGDPDSIRGASSIIGAGRVALTVNIMSVEECVKLGVPEDSRRDYFRVDDAKKNYSRIQDAEWFERIEYQLDNHDRVAVPLPWFPPTVALDQAAMSQIEALVARGSPVGPWSPRLSADPRSIAQGFASLGIEGKAAQTQALQQIKASGLVEIAQYRKARKTRADSPNALRTSNGEPRSVEWWDTEGAQNGE